VISSNMQIWRANQEHGPATTAYYDPTPGGGGFSANTERVCIDFRLVLKRIKNKIIIDLQVPACNKTCFDQLLYVSNNPKDMVLRADGSKVPTVYYFSFARQNYIGLALGIVWLEKYSTFVFFFTIFITRFLRTVCQWMTLS
jgi:hypothetical protein